jgi:hypothetical protein
MGSVLLDVRRARQRRLTLVALAACGLAMPFLALGLPRLAALCGPARPAAVVVHAVTVVVAAGAAAWSGREPQWTLADDVAWAMALMAFAVTGFLGAAPVTAVMLLHGAAALALAVRVPPVRLVLVTALSVLLGVLVRVASGAAPGLVHAGLLFGAMTLLAHVTVARATHALAYVLAEREALLSERRTLARPREKEPRPEREGAAAVIRSPRWKIGASLATEVRDEAPPLRGDEAGWESVVERVRSTVTTMCEPVGVTSSVRAELRGLAPPNSRMRQHVLKIAEEAAHHALRDTPPQTITITLRRGDGGLLLEVLDDGSEGEGVRSKRALAALRGRVAPLGGSAELRRDDGGWVMRVRLPCEQLN